MSRYKVKPTTRKSATVTFFDTFTVTTPALTRLEEEALTREQMEIRQRASVDSVGRLDDAAVANIQYAECDRYLSDWEGLTPDVCEAFGCEFEEYPALGADGTIPFDREFARALWRNAPYQQFAAVVIEKSKSINAQAFYAKKKLPSSSANLRAA